MHTFLYTCKLTFGGGLPPSSQIVGSLLSTPLSAKPAGKLI